MINTDLQDSAHFWHCRILLRGIIYSDYPLGLSPTYHALSVVHGWCRPSASADLQKESRYSGK